MKGDNGPLAFDLRSASRRPQAPAVSLSILVGTVHTARGMGLQRPPSLQTWFFPRPEGGRCFNPSVGIPGVQAPEDRLGHQPLRRLVSIPQSGFHTFKLPTARPLGGRRVFAVSIPQSGFHAFKRQIWRSFCHHFTDPTTDCQAAKTASPFANRSLHSVSFSHPLPNPQRLRAPPHSSHPMFGLRALGSPDMGGSD